VSTLNTTVENCRAKKKLWLVAALIRVAEIIETLTAGGFGICSGCMEQASM
jgi:hypothetical protein